MAGHIVVVGAGLLGVCTAYFLRRHGFDVTVVEHEQGPALGASYANGGYQQASAPDPWNAPGAFQLFLKAWMAGITGKGDQSAFCARTSVLPGLLGWGRKFMSCANTDTFLDHTLKNHRLASYTRDVMGELNQAESLSYSRSDRGGLIIFRSVESMASYVEFVGFLSDHGARYEVLERDGLIEKEPSLSEIRKELVGAVYFPEDEFGNPRAFCTQLADICQKRGAVFRYGSRAARISPADHGVRVTAGLEAYSADAVVIAAGAQSSILASTVGIRLPIAPVKGYSISIPMGDWSNRPSHVIADMGVHAGVNPMGDFLRVAGTAEFSGFRPGINRARTDYMINLARQIFPQFARHLDHDDIDPWAGFRPLSADGLPMIGASNVDNVYLNTGHGGLGWTQAAGSSKALADQIAGGKPELDLADYSLTRF